MLVIFSAAIWTLGRQVLLVGLLLQPVIAPKAHGVSTVAKLDSSVCDVQRLGAKRAGVCVVHHKCYRLYRVHNKDTKLFVEAIRLLCA